MQKKHFVLLLNLIYYANTSFLTSHTMDVISAHAINPATIASGPPPRAAIINIPTTTPMWDIPFENAVLATSAELAIKKNVVKS